MAINKAAVLPLAASLAFFLALPASAQDRIPEGAGGHVSAENEGHNDKPGTAPHND